MLLALVGCQEPTPVSPVVDSPTVASPLWGRLEVGAFGVGLRRITFADATRVDTQLESQDGGRPIEVFLWYPAARGEDQARLQFEDYLRFLPQFRANPQPGDLQEWLSVGISGAADGVQRETLDLILSSAMQARRGASPSPGAFPLVLWTMRHETMVAQSVLCEYLASHGYVVAAARYAGPALPMPWAMETEDEKLSTFATHLQDLSFALERLEQEAGIDASRVAVMTWSYAAELAPRIQVEHANVQLVVGLSSNPLSQTGLYQGELAASHLDVERLRVPYVIMTERMGFNGQERTPPAILSELSSESYYVLFDDLAHGNFNALEGMIPGVFGIATVQPWSKGGEVAQLGYETISRYLLSFLDQYLEQEAASQVDGTWQAELPPGFVTVTRSGSGL